MNRWTGYFLSLGFLVLFTLAAPALLPAQTAMSNPAQQPAQATPSFQPTHEQIGDSLMAHQRYQAAIEEYKQAPRDSATAWNKRGIALQLMFNIEEAERCYREALKLEPKNPTFLNNLGSVYMAQRSYSKAEKSYRKAVHYDPKSALFHKNLGTALLAKRKYQQGWEAYQAALKLDPTIFDRNRSSSIRVENPASVQDRGAMNFYMAKGCVRAGMLERAVEYLRMALNEGFTNPKKILADAELASLRNVPQFQKLMASQGVYLTDPNARPVAYQRQE